ncbi:MAG: cadherin repeat domain-containing protein [Candidatus Glassbacteria bacterium]|nr:cadherin repeat domain-containing protein [Candidatus Glassbacteria bacterium]
MRLTAFLSVASLLFACVLPAADDLRTTCGSPPEYHVESAGGGEHVYSIRMGGKIDGEMTRDPVGYWAYDQYWEPNVLVRIANTGGVAVVNPWLRRADMPDYRSLDALVWSIVESSMSDGERARRLWEWQIGHRFHATTEDDEVNDVVKLHNCYGYTLCYNESLVMSDLWRAAGLEVRAGYPNGHSTAEVFYDGAWHLLDSDESIICLLRDNETIASEAQIVADHDLMKRTHTYGPLHSDSRMNDESSASLVFWEGERGRVHPGKTSHRMDFTLRPGEAVSWRWQRGKDFHGKAYQGSETEHYFWNKRWRLIAHVMNGSWTYDCDLTTAANLPYVEARGVELAPDGPFGAGLYLAADSGSVTVPVHTAWPVVGGMLEVDMGRGDTRLDNIRVLASFDDGENWQDIWTSAVSEYVRMYIDLDEFFPMRDPARYDWLLRFELESTAESPLVCLKGFYLDATLQMARLAMPGVRLGDNSFIYTDRSPAGAEVEITHSWSECADVLVPARPAGAVYPPDNGTADGTMFTFEWRPVEHADDYQFQLSEFEDMRWPLSPNFNKLISKTANRRSSSFSLPYHGLLNPDRSYYWRVRARSAQGVWGPWSKSFSFKCESPAVPVEVKAMPNPFAPSWGLQWQPGEGGSEPVRYKIYGSSERGFTASDTAYAYDGGLAGILHAPANLLHITEGAQTYCNAWNILRPYYRVVAIDAAGRESGPSDAAEMPHPLITGPAKLPSGRVSSQYRAQVEVSASIGHLVSQDENGKPYQLRYRSGDELSFGLEGAPGSLVIDPDSGLISGYLPHDAAGSHLLKVKVTDLRTGHSLERQFTLEIN